MKVELNHHSIILMCGPTGCGKSTLVRNLTDAISRQTTSPYNTLVVSSDQIRSALLAGTHHKHDPAMLEVSEQAFSVLFNEVENASSFPVNTPFIFVDTRGSDPAFRQRIRGIAEKNHYNLVCVSFEYKNASDYSIGLPENEARITAFDVQKYRRKVLPDLRTRDFQKMVKVRTKQACLDPVELTLPDLVEYENSNIILDKKLAIIGDSHECVVELASLGKILTEASDPVQIVHVGDYLDKGQDTLKMLEYMTTAAVIRGDILIAGNHEAYLYRRLKGLIEPANKEVEEEYFTALPVLLENEEARTKFFNLFENYTVPYLKATAPGQRTVYITHAPCEEKYLGKHSFQAQRAQRNLYVKNREGDIRDEMAFLYSQANQTRPLHVFGHVSHASPSLTYKNKVFLDTGCVHGNKLTAMVMQNNHYDFISVNNERRILAESIPTNLTTLLSGQPKKFNIHDYDLSPADLRFVNGAMKNNVKFISGTMAPAPSTVNKLEPLESAFEYYRSRGVNEVVLQPKYMGSRCQLYLFKGVEDEPFAVSRNGYKIKHVEGMDELLQEWQKKCEDWYDGSWNSIIIDGELLPWSALGKGLVENQFRSYEHLIDNELSILATDTEFATLDIAQNYDVEGRLDQLETFSLNLALHSGDSPLEFKAFNILSCDGGYVGGTPEWIFKDVSTDGCQVVKLDDESSIKMGVDFFNQITLKLGMEGVVVKPNLDFENIPAKVPEYMKVRNEGYLTLVYGYDYKRRYHKLVQQKNISRKVGISISESKLGRAMLTADEELRKELIVKMTSELNNEKSLDPRL